MERFFSGDIFEDMRIRTGSSYISDLPYKKQQVWEEGAVYGFYELCIWKGIKRPLRIEDKSEKQGGCGTK